MQVQDIKIDRYKMQMCVELPAESAYCELLSEEYVINGIVKFQIKAIMSDKKKVWPSNTYYYPISHIWILAKFINVTKNTEISIKFTSNALSVKYKCIMADSEWHLIPKDYVSLYKFDINFTVELKSSNVNKMKALYDDDELTDFELRGVDGSVRVHKCMLAATSPVFQTMLQGEWKETNTGCMHLEGLSKVTLQDFKTYIYLNTLPLTGSEQMLIIAMRYDIPEMETMCIKNLIQNMNAENVRHLLELALTHKSERLTEAILECFQFGVIKVGEVTNHRENGKDNKKSNTT